MERIRKRLADKLCKGLCGKVPLPEGATSIYHPGEVEPKSRIRMLIDKMCGGRCNAYLIKEGEFCVFSFPTPFRNSLTGNGKIRNEDEGRS